MKFLLFVFLISLSTMSTSGVKYEYSQIAKNCIEEIKTNEETLRSLIPEDKRFPEDNELVSEFFACIYRANINDNNELIIDDNLKNYVKQIVTVRMEGKSKLAALVGNDCLEHCKGLKGESKGKTAVKVMNCIKERLSEYVNE